MTRKRLLHKIDGCLQEPVDSQAIEQIVDCTLQYLLDYTQLLSSQLMSHHPPLHSEAMTAGTVIAKLKDLLNGA